MTDRTVLGPRPPYQILFPLFAVASFLLYALGVLSLHQDRAPGWALEAPGAIPAAVSYQVYGTPLGALDDNVLRSFLYADGRSVQDILATAASGSVPHGAVDMYSLDGTGAGTNLFATVAMELFGIRISSLVLFYLVFVGISVLAFVLRYRDKRLLVVPLYFLALTVMLLTPLCTSAEAVDQMPIGGQRYFAVAAFLPVLHFFFELIEHAEAPGRKRQSRNWLLLFIQGILFIWIMLIRASVGYMFGALLCVWIWQLYQARKRRVEIIPLLRIGAAGAAACAFWAVIVVAELPAYLQSGRALGNFWHRAFATLALDPDWPYGDLRTVYDCRRYIPEGLNQENVDRNGHCIWFVYPPNAKRSLSEVSNGIYGREYEKSMRDAYFYVLLRYPKQVFNLYVHVKSQYIERVLTQAWDFLFALHRAPVAKDLFVIASAQLMLFLAFIVSGAVAKLTVVDRPLIIFPILFVLSLTPLYVASANSWTTADTVFLMYACLALIASLVVQFTTEALAAAVSKISPAGPNKVLPN